MTINLPWQGSKAQQSRWTAPIEDVKNKIGEQLDHLAQVAADVTRDAAAQVAQVTQDAGAQAASVAKDLSEQAVKTTQNAGSQAAAVAKDVPAGASTLAQQAIRGASQLGKDLRSIRVTREPAPAQRGPDVMPGIALLAGFGGGIALMYFFDPEQGRRRRALLRDQLTKWTRVGRESVSGRATDLRNRTTGLAHETRKAIGGAGTEETEIDTHAETGYGEFESQLPENGSEGYDANQLGQRNDQYTSIPIEGGNEAETSEIR
jgi:hypothetical protein